MKKTDTRLEQSLEICVPLSKKKGCALALEAIQDAVPVKIRYGMPLKKIQQALMDMGFNRPMQGPRKHTQESLINYLQDLGKRLGRTPGVRDITRDGQCPHTVFFYNFGSLRKAQKAAGFAPNPRGHQPGRKSAKKKK